MSRSPNWLRVVITIDELAYDPCGNRIRVWADGVQTTANFGDMGEITSFGTDTFTTDHFGNMKTQMVGLNTTTFDWDFESHLTGIDYPGTATATPTSRSAKSAARCASCATTATASLKGRATFRSDGKDIEAGDGGPCLTDWNADGKLDLLLGDEAGNVIFYPSTAKGSLELGKAEYVLPHQTTEQGWREVKRDPASPTGLSTRRPGARVKPFAADWNGDGKLDLLVGDPVQIEQPPRKLNAQQAARLARLKRDRDEMSRRHSAAYNAAQREALKDVGLKTVANLKPEKLKEFNEAYRKRIQEKLKAITADQKWQMELHNAISELEPRPEATGFVWVYLRK